MFRNVSSFVLWALDLGFRYMVTDSNLTSPLNTSAWTLSGAPRCADGSTAQSLPDLDHDADPLFCNLSGTSEGLLPNSRNRLFYEMCNYP